MPANPKTDPVPLCISILTSNWQSVNTSGVTPLIVDGSSGQKFNREAKGFIRVYQGGPVRRESKVVRGDFKFHWEPVTIHVDASTRAKSHELLKEVERILNLKRKDPDAYWDWVEDLGETPTQDYPHWFSTKVQTEFIAHSVEVAE